MPQSTVSIKALLTILLFAPLAHSCFAQELEVCLLLETTCDGMSQSFSCCAHDYAAAEACVVAECEQYERDHSVDCDCNAIPDDVEPPPGFSLAPLQNRGEWYVRVTVMCANCQPRAARRHGKTYCEAFRAARDAARRYCDYCCCGSKRTVKVEILERPCIQCPTVCKPVANSCVQPAKSKCCPAPATKRRRLLGIFRR